MSKLFGEDKMVGSKFMREDFKDPEWPKWMSPERKAISNRILEKRRSNIKKRREKAGNKLRKGMNPDGFWETPYVKGMRWNVNDADNFKKWEDPACEEVIKIISPGIYGTDPRFIHKVVFMLRDPRSVATSQEDLLHPTPLVDGEKLDNGFRNNSPMFWIRSYRAAARFFKDNPQIEVYFVKYDDLVANPKDTLQGVANFFGGEYDLDAAVSAVKPKLKRSVPKEIDDEPWDDAESIFEMMQAQNYAGILKQAEDHTAESNQLRTWHCFRMGRMVTRTECKLCRTNPTVMENYKIAADARDVPWYDEPCTYECGIDPDPSKHISIEESIENNSWGE
jgi:hypothetical protein